MTTHLPPLTLKSRLAVAALTLVFLAIYVWGAAPSIMRGDSAELQTVALAGGLGHPSGYPLFIMAGQIFRHVVGGDLAHRITLMCAIFGAAAVGVHVLLLRQTGLSLGFCLLGAAWYGTTFTVWWSSIRTEVYSLALLCFTVSMWKTLAYLRGRRGRDAILAAFSLGLTMTGSLWFGPAVMVMGLTLAFLRPERGSLFRHMAFLLLAFLMGLSPYLYLFWADAQKLPMNYINYVVHTDLGQFGLTPATFDDLWERIPWLVFCRQANSVAQFGPLKKILWNILDTAPFTFLFEFGPLALVPFFAGVVGHLRRWTLVSWLFLAVAASTWVFAICFSGDYGLFLLTLMAFTSVLGVLIAQGTAAIVGAMRGRLHIPRAGAVILGGAALLVALFLPHALRLHAYDSPIGIGRLRWWVREEGPPAIKSLIPQLRDYWEPKEWGTLAARILPDSALVVGGWNDINILFYLSYVKGERQDLALDHWYPQHMQRLVDWQAAHGLGKRPVVLTRSPLSLLFLPVRADSMPVTPGRWLYVLREPIAERLSHPAGAVSGDEGRPR